MENKLTKETLETLLQLIKAKETINAKIVVISKKTLEDNTYLIRGKQDKNKNHYFLNVSYEANYNEFVTVAFEMHQRVHYLSNYGTGTSVVIKGAYWLLTKIVQNKLDDIFLVADLKHTGNCLKCNRTLTDAESIEYGMGKTCRNK